MTFFLIANPIGNLPAIVAIVKDFDFKRQKIILAREAFFALLLALFFQYAGELFLNLLKIQDYAVTISGGLLLITVAMRMVFSQGHKAKESAKVKEEPYIVPIATPILSGPGLLATIVLQSKLVDSNLMITLAIFLAWVAVIAVLEFAPYLQKILGRRGLIALEQVMGMILAFISIEMLVRGTTMFLKTL